jgi:uncharacterized RDD family membrane protein YckC
MNIGIKRVMGFGIDLMVQAWLGIILEPILIETNFITKSLFIPIFFISFFFRDTIFKEGSFGKKVMKLKLVFHSPKYEFTRRIIRNVTTLISPIEGIFLLIFKKRIGDFIANTNVEEK